MANIVQAVGQHVADEIKDTIIDYNGQQFNLKDYVKTNNRKNGFSNIIEMCDIATDFYIDDKAIAHMTVTCNKRKTYKYHISIMDPKFMDLVEEQVINVVKLLAQLLKSQLMFRRLTWK